MKTRNILLAAVFLLSFCGATFADRELDRTEILQIFAQLTNQPRRTWIPAGTIEATREEYKAAKITDINVINYQVKQRIQEYLNNPDKRELTANLQKMKLDAMPFNIRYDLSNEYTMVSTVTVKYDGVRFYWEINIDSRNDSVKPGKDLEGNFMSDHLNLDWNGRRIFVWDGEKHTSYVPGANHSMVDSTVGGSHVANGPLTAGVIPWGHGYYAYENLCNIESSAVEKYIGGQVQIHLTLSDSDGLEMVFVMDPEKDYAVLSSSINGRGNSVVSRQYSDYQLISGNWVPTTILMGRYEADTNKLLAYDLWNITSIDASVPEADSFNANYEADTLVEYNCSITDRPVKYRHSNLVDTDLLLGERLEVAASEGTQTQNCATVALKYALSQLGQDVTEQQLAPLVTEPNQTTNLYAMKQFAEGLGLYCRAVATDIQTLKSLTGCEVILHIPGKKHFVVLESVDDENVRIIDLAKNTFYYRTDVAYFDMDWTEGTALLISNGYIPGNFTEIDDAQLGSIVGGAGWDCNRFLQDSDYIGCAYIAGECTGYCYCFEQRWGCGPAEEGSCSNELLVRYKKTACVNKPEEPWECNTLPNPEWIYYYMWACD